VVQVVDVAEQFVAVHRAVHVALVDDRLDLAVEVLAEAGAELVVGACRSVGGRRTPISGASPKRVPRHI
jgi:hypothetical protein